MIVWAIKKYNYNNVNVRTIKNIIIFKMIITDTIEIKTSNKNISHYNKLGFNVKSGDLIIISPHQLPITSKTKIEVECDNCHRRLKILYHSYYRNAKEGIYYCSKCSSIRGKETSLLLYGSEHPMQNKNILEKTIRTNLEKYGVGHPSQNKNVKEKIKKTNLEKYGETSYMKTEQFKIDSLKTNLKKYGVEHPLQNENIKNKLKETCLKKYGFDSPLKSNEIKIKISKTKKDKYCDEKYNNREKYKETCLEIFGFENPMSNLDIQNKLKKNHVKKIWRGIWGTE